MELIIISIMILVDAFSTQRKLENSLVKEMS